MTHGYKMHKASTRKFHTPHPTLMLFPQRKWLPRGTNVNVINSPTEITRNSLGSPHQSTLGAWEQRPFRIQTSNTRHSQWHLKFGSSIDKDLEVISRVFKHVEMARLLACKSLIHDVLRLGSRIESAEQN